MKKQNYKLACRVSDLTDSFYREGYQYERTYWEALGSSYEVKRLKHENGNVIDVAVSLLHREIIIKKNGKIIKHEQL